MKSYPIVVGAVLLMVGLTACGTQTSTPSQATQAPTTHAQTVSFGPTALKPGAVWQLNSPGTGAPRESLSIEQIHGHTIDVTMYLSEFGSLLQSNLSGTVKNAHHLTLSGTLNESSITGSAETVPVQMIWQPVKRHTIWVTQTIPHNQTDSFSQLSFHDQ